jgi:hypothetical protein
MIFGSSESYQTEIANQVININDDEKSRLNFAKDVLEKLAQIALFGLRKQDSQDAVESMLANYDNLSEAISKFNKSVKQLGPNGKSLESKFKNRFLRQFHFSPPIFFFMRLLVLFRRDLEIIKVHKKKRGPQTIIPEEIAFMVAKSYLDYLGEMPTHAKADTNKTPSPYDRVCNLINEIFKSTGKELFYGSINDNPRKLAIKKLEKMKKEKSIGIVSLKTN